MKNTSPTVGQRMMLWAAALTAVALAAYGVAGSYSTIATLADQKDVPLPWLVPVGLDGGFLGVNLLDLALTWTGCSVIWLRQVARLLTAGTVAANFFAGWPDLLAAGLHSAAPVMFLVMVEAARTVFLRRLRLADATVRERIPRLRWVLDPWRTWLMWRRMVLWQITSYEAAVATEQLLGRLTAFLKGTFGSDWRRTAPAELLWKLKTGVDLADLFDELKQSAAGGSGVWDKLAIPDGEVVSIRPFAVDEQTDRLEQAKALNKQHLAIHGRPASSDTIRLALRIGAAQARALTKDIRQSMCS
ncbi:DUF2637 domain-containing protein [Pseudonocardiaceae bacterium YIM PH 21723]|nr:DUF2637 domain-containing protein [Pseudonocardiaceae bacterium YIM PH 21723]